MLSRRQTDEEPRRRSRATWIVAVLVVVFVLYLLSAGPMLFLNRHGYISDGAVTTAYRPIIYLIDGFPTIKSWVRNYLALWK